MFYGHRTCCGDVPIVLRETHKILDRSDARKCSNAAEVYPFFKAVFKTYVNCGWIWLCADASRCFMFSQESLSSFSYDYNHYHHRLNHQHPHHHRHRYLRQRLDKSIHRYIEETIESSMYYWINRSIDRSLDLSIVNLLIYWFINLLMYPLSIW